MSKIIRTLAAVSALLLMVALAGGCTQPVLERMGYSGTDSSSAYGDFNDIRIPSSLNKDNAKTFIYESGGFKAGTLFYEGYVDVDSLVDFFSQAMAQDGWKLLSTFRYPDMLLLFQKPEKACVIIISEGMIMTRVSIRVAPTAS